MRFQSSFSDLLLEGWNYAWLLVSEILIDPYSHTAAALSGWSFVPTPEDVNFYNWADAYRLMKTPAGKVRPQPLPRPWVTRKRVSKARALSAEEVELRNRLKVRLGVS